MNRKIRFRAWDKARQIMIGYDYHKNWDKEADSEEYYAPSYSLWLGFIEQACEDEGLIVEQFTGLIDKNFNPIYENDIIKREWSYNNTVTVKVVQWDDRRAGFTTDKERLADYFHNHPGDLYEVIGNIHENPELLEEIYGPPGIKY